MEKIAFWGNFGTGNLGNECTLQATIANIRQRFPQARLVCICTGPEDASRRHDLECLSIQPALAGSGFGNAVPPAQRLLRKLLFAVPNEFRRCRQAFSALEGVDALVVPGTQVLAKYDSEVLGWTYFALKWAVIAKLRGSSLIFLNVGVGPIRGRIARFCAKAALLLADYRAYRDHDSKEYARRLGVEVAPDVVCPDLAFGLPESVMGTRIGRQEDADAIALGVVDYHGQFSESAPADSALLYQNYLERTAELVVRLAEGGRTVRMIIGDLSYDRTVVNDVTSILREKGSEACRERLEIPPIHCVDDLISHIRRSRVVISPRFHNIVLALLCEKPVIAIAYQKKFAELMGDLGLQDYVVPIDDFQPERVLQQLRCIDARYEDIKELVGSRVALYQNSLREQYDLIFDRKW